MQNEPMSSAPRISFDYSLAFSRNLGWISPTEQERLRKTRIAIAGMGGVGGVHLLTMARLGISHFHIADFDTYEIQNFNRQVGADMSTIGKSKVKVMKEKALLINPEMQMKVFDSGIDDRNISDFLENIDIYVDGLDVFVLEFRRKIFAECRKRNIPVITVAPIGMGSACLHFSPKGMSADEYFGWDGKPEVEMYARFVLGLAPHFLHLKSLVDRTYANAHNKKAPSLPMGCELAAGVMASEVLKIRLNRGKIFKAPWSYQIDIASLRFKSSWLFAGAKNPIFKLKLKIMLWILNKEPHEPKTK